MESKMEQFDHTDGKMKSLDGCISELASIGFLETQGPSSVEDYLSIASLVELKQLAKQYHIKANTKSALIKQLLDTANQSTMFHSKEEVIGILFMRAISAVGDLVRLSSDPLHAFRMFFVIYARLEAWPANDAFMTDSILANLSGTVQVKKVSGGEEKENVTSDIDESVDTCEIETRERRRKYVRVNYTRFALVWPAIDDLREYVDGLEMEFKLAQLAELNSTESFQEIVKFSHLVSEWQSRLNPHITDLPYLNRFTKGNVLTRCLGIIYNANFRLKEYQECVVLLKCLLDQQIFGRNKRGYWYNELARILERYIDKDNALEVCKQALNDPYVHSHHHTSIMKRFARLSGTKIPKPTVNSHTVECKYLFDPQTVIDGVKLKQVKDKQRVIVEGGLTVEQYCLKWYREQGYKGFHSETSILSTLFGLLFWNVIFDDSIPGAFNSPYQVAPLDLQTEYFYESRKDTIDVNLGEIRNGKANDLLELVWNRERYNRCVGVNWDYELQDLLEICDCIGGEKLAHICDLFAKTYWAHSGGVPDLCVWKLDTLEFKLVEVKSQNDVLSEKQRVWLWYLDKFEIDHLVFHVKDVRKRKCLE
ncbi:hypothetical protein HK103_007414 [Boothiomyces macroporosus]|uniref:Fanconi-associated nuclease n=1 Tax=Boothiomyces macroporosus TaxID=261099 RepID=A0AAD5UKU8_9FUNG|nr:hypothetical protein HK103_007414 [Boothiomyces macroporosus]